jgi:DNA-binding beta-propeller fold protein YncE
MVGEEKEVVSIMPESQSKPNHRLQAARVSKFNQAVTRALRAAAAVVFLGAGLYAVTPKSEVYTINIKPPSVSIIDSESWKLLATVPVDPSPDYAVTDPSGKSLYVLHNGWLNDTLLPPSNPSTITVVDLVTRKAVRSIKVGWHAYKLSLIKEGRYLLCFSRGFPGSKKVERESGAVTIIDTEKADSVATLSAGRLGKEVLFSKDGSKIFVLSAGEGPDKKKNKPEVKPALTVFELERDKPLAEVELAQEIQEMSLSRDERWLYLLDAGVASKNPKKHRNGAVYVFDAEAMTLRTPLDVGVSPRSLDVDPTSEYAAVLSQVSAKDSAGKLYLLKGDELTRSVDVGADPRFLKRPENQSGRFVFSHGDMRFLGDDGVLATSFVPLNKAKNASSGAEVKYLDGNPGEVLTLPGGERVAMTVNTAFGVPTSKVAIVNVKTNQVERIVATGRGGVKFGQFMGAMALSVAMSSLSYYANYSIARSTGQPYFFYNVYVFSPRAPTLSLAASADGKTLYALNTSTNDVTMIDVAKGEVLGHVAVGGGARQVMLAPGGRFVCAYSDKEITLIDTETNKQHSEHKLADAKVMTVSPDPNSGRVLALLSNGLEVWDTNEGKLVTTVSGLTQARFLAHSAAE